jgi:GrpB-like predicted nucleotidyltransferase (UPF0157 family)
VTSDHTIVELHPYDPSWLTIAREESDRLARVLDDNLIRIEHVGSTAIRGICAKPRIDLMPLVRDLHEVNASAIQALEYEWRGEFGLSGRRYCTFTDPQTARRVFQVHIFEIDSPHAARMIAFRDYLLAHADEARAYEAEKRRAAALHPANSRDYNDAKSDWIQACERRALAWKES